MTQATLQARALKVTLVLDPAATAEALRPHAETIGRVQVRIRLPDQTLEADFAAKSVRKALSLIDENGPEGVAVIIQGKLVSGVITEAGLVAQVKVPKPQVQAA
jgi:hypothetical protein